MPSNTAIEIIPADCYTKAAYARKIGKSQTWVDILVKDGKLECIEINGSSFVRENIAPSLMHLASVEKKLSGLLR